MVSFMRGRFLRVAGALCGLAGAVYAADRATDPDLPDLGQTIATQRINEGQLVKSGQAQQEAVAGYGVDQMLDLAEKYSQQMKTAIEHAEDVRILAYRSRDIIRMTCIEDKLAQMKVIVNVAQPRFLTLRTFKTAAPVMREQFSVIFQAQERLAELAGEVDLCLGDSLDAVTAGRIQEETPSDNDVIDPTRPPTPIQAVERPPEASPYN